MHFQVTLYVPLSGPKHNFYIHKYLWLIRLVAVCCFCFFRLQFSFALFINVCCNQTQIVFVSFSILLISLPSRRFFFLLSIFWRFQLILFCFLIIWLKTKRKKNKNNKQTECLSRHAQVLMESLLLFEVYLAIMFTLYSTYAKSSPHSFILP